MAPRKVVVIMRRLMLRKVLVIQQRAVIVIRRNLMMIEVLVI